MMMFRVLIYSSQPLIKKGLSFYLNKCITDAEISETNSLNFLNKAKQKNGYDLFIFDLSSLTEINLMYNLLSTFFIKKNSVFS